jgi:hypothetical protein
VARWDGGHLRCLVEELVDVALPPEQLDFGPLDQLAELGVGVAYLPGPTPYRRRSGRVRYELFELLRGGGLASVPAGISSRFMGIMGTGGGELGYSQSGSAGRIAPGRSHPLRSLAS